MFNAIPKEVYIHSLGPSRGDRVQLSTGLEDASALARIPDTVGLAVLRLCLTVMVFGLRLVCMPCLQIMNADRGYERCTGSPATTWR